MRPTADRITRGMLCAAFLLFSVDAAGIGTGSSTQAASQRLDLLYAERGGQPLWEPASARQLVALLLLAGRHGLDPEEYRASTWLREVTSSHARLAPATDRGLSEALLRYARDLALGRVDPRDVDEGWLHEQPPFDPFTLLAGDPAGASLFARVAALAPTEPFYAGLQEALAHYREITDRGGWPLLGDGPWLRPGDSHAQVALLRTRLAVESPELVTDGEPTHFDDTLEDALRAFQRRHGLKEDAVVGPQTRAALNVSAADRVMQLRANLERWRWLPRDLGPNYLLVNSAGFDLALVRDGETLLRSRTVTGRPSRFSPSLSSRVTHVVLNPDWTVPYRIATRDLLPKQQADPDYLPSRSIQVLDRRDGFRDELDPAQVDWSALDRRGFPYVLRQTPGPHNSLGRFKFHMPNRHSIFLHDTPEKQLFDAPARAFSSGCIRVEESARLAELLLSGSNWDRDAIAAKVASGDTRHVELADPVPVYLVYLTAWRDPDGTFQFRPDIYGRDPALVTALQEGRDERGQQLAAGELHGPS